MKSKESDKPSKVADKPFKDEPSGTISQAERPKRGSRQGNEDKTPEEDRPKQDITEKENPKGGDQDKPKDDKAKEAKQEDKTEDKPKSGGTCDGGCPTETDCVEASICQPLGNGKSKCSNPKKKNGNPCTLPGGGSGTCGGGKCKPKQEEEEGTGRCVTVCDHGMVPSGISEVAAASPFFCPVQAEVKTIRLLSYYSACSPTYLVGRRTSRCHAEHGNICNHRGHTFVLNASCMHTPQGCGSCTASVVTTAVQCTVQPGVTGPVSSHGGMRHSLAA